MNDNKEGKLICKALRTRDRAQEFVNQIDAMSRALGFKDIPENFNEILSDEFVELFTRVINEMGLDPVTMLQNKEKLDVVLKELRQYVIDLNNLEVEIPIQLTDEFKDSLYNWFNENSSESFLIRFIYKPEIKAGLNFSWLGKYHNFSLEKVLSKYLAENKDGIERILHQKV